MINNNLKAAAVVISAAIGLISNALADQPYTGQTLRFATFGGAWQKWVEQTVVPPFTAETAPGSKSCPAIRSNSWHLGIVTAPNAHVALQLKARAD
jgi:hypothetical protein